MAYKDLREYLKALDEKGKLKRVKKEVDKDWEIGCIARWMYQSVPEKDRYGIMFSNVKGFDIPVVTGVCGASRDIYAIGLKTTPDKIFEKWVEALKKPVMPVEKSSGPVKEVIEKGNEVELSRIPIPLWTPGKDIAPYITAGCVITKDPDTGIQNMGIYRVMYKGKDKLGILIVPKQDIGIHYYKKYEARGMSMPVAIAIGVDPTIAYTSAGKFSSKMDELAVSGGLRGEPVEVVRGEVVDLLIPAHAEYVIEGFVPPYERESEGPFGELSGYMGPEGKRTFIEVKCVTHRKNPIYQGFISQVPPSESSMIKGQARAATIYKRLVYDLEEPGITDIHLPEASGSGLSVYIQMKPQYAGHSKKVGIIVSSLIDPSLHKYITILDDDIDIRDPFSVEWAVAFRVDPSKDITKIENCLSKALDPSTDKSGEGGGKSLTGTKVIIDATLKEDFPELSLPDSEYMYKILNEWRQTGLPEITVNDRTRLLLEKHSKNKK